MISIQKQFLFIHVPKTGGNSIQNILRDYSEDDIVTLTDFQDGFERFEVRNSKYDITKHSTLSHYKSVLDPELFGSLFKFATMRNPWDMMISFYFSPHRGVTEWDRDDFLKIISRVKTLRHYICVTSSLDKAIKKIRFPGLRNRRRLDRYVDYMLRFESLDDDFQVLCRKLDIPFSPLPKTNRSSRTHYSKYYDDELKEIVRRKFTEEIEFGDYSFEKS